MLQSVLSHSHDTLKACLSQADLDLKEPIHSQTLDNEEHICSLLCKLQCACANNAASCCVSSAAEWKRQTLLHFAVLACDDVACQLILDHDPSCVDVTADGGYTPLHLAAAMYSCTTRCGNSSTGKSYSGKVTDRLQSLKHIVQVICEKGGNVNARTEGGESVLHCAHLDLLDVLVAFGCDINAQKKYGYTKLMLCARTGDLDMMRRLVTLGCDINVQNSCWSTALMLAVNRASCQQGQPLEAVELLLEAGSDVNKVNNQGKTALILAAENGSMRCVKLLLQHNPSVDRFDIEGQTALSIFALSGNIEGVKLVLPFSSCLDFNPRSLTTPLWDASRAGHQEIVRLLLLAKADMDVVCGMNDMEGISRSTPVMAAILSGHLETSHLLLRAGCDRRHLATLLAAPPKSLGQRITSSDLHFLRQLCCTPHSLRDLVSGCIRRNLQMPADVSAEVLPLPKALRAEVLFL